MGKEKKTKGSWSVRKRKRARKRPNIASTASSAKEVKTVTFPGLGEAGGGGGRSIALQKSAVGPRKAGA